MADKEDKTGPDTSYTGPEAEWDFDFARRLMGKYIMASFSYLKPDGVTVREHEQVHGVVIDATRDEGFTLALRGARKGETIVLPPNPSAFVKLAPGNYRLSSTNERVVNPDYTSLWRVVDAENKTD
jgi:hypothetical protein